MLQSLRENTRGLVAGILIGLLVIIFAISGAEALFTSSGSAGKVLTVNGESITQVEVERAVRMQRQQMQSMYGDAIPAEFLSDERLRGPAIENLIQRRILTQTANKSGMAVSTDTINELIVSTPMFQNESGVFEPARFQQILRMQGMTPSMYRALLAEEVLINQLALGVAESGFVTPAELARVVALANQTRNFVYAVIDAEQVRAGLAVSDEDIASYYAANPQVFTQAEQVAVDYIDLSVEQLMAAVDVSEQQLRQQYEQDVANFRASIQRNAAHILIEDADAARVADLQAQLAAGADFAELAREHSDDIGTRAQGGDLGYTAGDAFPREFEQALAALSVGEVSAPVRTDAGVHLIKLLDERGAEPPSFEEERGRISVLLKRARAESDFVALLDRLRDQAYNAENLREVAEDLGLTAGNTGLFTRSGGSGVAAQSAVISAAFSEEVLEYGNSSDLIELGNDRVVVVKKTGHRAEHIKPLDEVRDQAANLIRDERARAQVAERGAALRAALQAGQDPAAAAAEAGATLVTAEAVGRNDMSVDRDVLRRAFSVARPGEGFAVGGGHKSNGDYVVVKVTGVQDGVLSAQAPEQQRAMQASMSRLLGEDEFGSYQAMLRAQAKIKR